MHLCNISKEKLTPKSENLTFTQLCCRGSWRFGKQRVIPQATWELVLSVVSRPLKTKDLFDMVLNFFHIPKTPLFLQNAAQIMSALSALFYTNIFNTNI